MGTILGYITLVVILIVVLALVIYLLLIIKALRGASSNLYELAGGLDQIVKDSAPLPGKLTTINGALGELLKGLLSVNNNLAAVAQLLNR